MTLPTLPRSVTPIFQWPFPDYDNAADGPNGISQLAIAAENTVKSLDDRIAALERGRLTVAAVRTRSPQIRPIATNTPYWGRFPFSDLTAAPDPSWYDSNENAIVIRKDGLYIGQIYIRYGWEDGKSPPSFDRAWPIGTMMKPVGSDLWDAHCPVIYTPMSVGLCEAHCVFGYTYRIGDMIQAGALNEPINQDGTDYWLVTVTGGSSGIISVSLTLTLLKEGTFRSTTELPPPPPKPGPIPTPG